MQFKRRDFVKICLGTAGYCLAYNLPELLAKVEAKEALYYEKQGNVIKCLRCPHTCIIKKNERGFCRIRENREGKLYNIVYALPCAVHIDPIEKKPFFHVLPGSNSFSLATAGCNLRCKFCQNWQISQAAPEEVNSIEMLPEEAVERAQNSGCSSVAYTYTEPTVFYEYTQDIAKLAKEKGLKNVMHSNGFINPEPLRNLCQYFTAINVDLKGFTEDFYRDICSANLKNVLESLVIIKKEMKVWLELTTLIIPTLNDNPDLIRKMCAWIKGNLGEAVPLHFSRFFPMYKLTNLPPTPVSTLENARNIAQEIGLKFVYIGNLPGHKAENTYCPNCQNEIVKRVGYSVLSNLIIGGKCKICSHPIPGVWA